MIDMTSDFGRHVDRRLSDEAVIWLTTVGEDTGPHPRLVWFLWDGRTFLIYSQPDTWKVRHLSSRPRVALHLNSDEAGEDVTVFLGQAELIEGGPAAEDHEGYLGKYGERIAGLGMSPAEFAGEYSLAIRVTPSELRGA
ncbi:MAG TPA: TIGR03667 family PPOX class F420-dependent oxidoreductase [Anaerolineales bacterium]|nr:TIGR03667 family PPOX class F420-dependent oxidoreductase [Anaerolineales bacterium]